MERQMEEVWSKLQKGIKFPFKIDNLLDIVERIKRGEKPIQSIETSGIRRIETGHAGYQLLKEIEEYKDVLVEQPSFDPIMANELINPIISTGYRLSSYMIYIYGDDDELIKFVPSIYSLGYKPSEGQQGL